MEHPILVTAAPKQVSNSKLRPKMVAHVEEVVAARDSSNWLGDYAEEIKVVLT